MEILVVIIVLAVAAAVVQSLWGKTKSQYSIKAAEPVIAANAATLARKYDQLTFKDDYGDWNFDRWDREKRDFIERKIRPVLPFLEYESEAWFAVEKAIDTAVDAYQAANPSVTPDLDEAA